MERLKRYLEAECLSQTELARLMSVSQPTVWGWLSGESLPSTENLKKLASLTRISVDELLDSPSEMWRQASN